MGESDARDEALASPIQHGPPKLHRDASSSSAVAVDGMRALSAIRYSLGSEYDGGDDGNARPGRDDSEWQEIVGVCYATEVDEALCTTRQLMLERSVIVSHNDPFRASSALASLASFPTSIEDPAFVPFH